MLTLALTLIPTQDETVTEALALSLTLTVTEGSAARVPHRNTYYHLFMEG